MTDETDDSTSIRDRVRGTVGRRFGVDVRALAALRIALGALLLVDLALRARDLRAFYSDAGVLPRSALARQYPTFHSISIHAVSGDAWAQGALFALAGVFAVALLVGYRTRLATVASLALLVSMHARNPFVLNAGDVLFRRLLFWGLFVPLGGRWAVDARADGDRSSRVATLATAGLLLQVVLVYATNVGFKLRGGAWLHGDAVRYVFSLDQFTVALGPVLADYPSLLAVGALGWFALLCSSPLLVVLTGRARAALVALFAGGHAAMLVTMDLGIFPLVSLVALLPFVPSSAWDRLDRRLPAVASTVEELAPSISRPRVGSTSLRVGPEFPGAARTRSSGERAATARSVLLALLVGAMLILNALAVGVVDRPAAVPDAIEDRSWNMFGNPPRVDSWYVAHGTFESGRRVTGYVGTARFDRPPDGERRYPKARWRKYQHKLAASGDAELHARLAADVCRRWSASADEPLRSVTLDRVSERTRLGAPDVRTVESRGRYACPATPADG